MTDDVLRGAVSAQRYEKQANGDIIIPISETAIRARGQFIYHKRGEAEEFSDNLIVDTGLDYLLGAALGGVAQLSNWYVAIFGGAVTVLPTWTAATFSTTATELSAYVAATRPSWTSGAVADGAISSYTTKAEFEATEAMTVRGGAMLSSPTKGSTAGTLLAASRFGTEKSLDTGEILDVGYRIELTAV